MKLNGICPPIPAALSALSRAQPPVEAAKAYLGLADSLIDSLTAIRQQQMNAAQSKTKAMEVALANGKTDATAPGR